MVLNTPHPPANAGTLSHMGRGRISVQGRIQKLKSALGDPAQSASQPVQYRLPIGDTEIPLNPLLGSTITLIFTGQIFCLNCNRTTKNSFNQGYCFPCAQSLARCDVCIIRPEKCHYHLGTCREPAWGEAHCFIPHVVYLANTSGLKVGITRETQIPTRWIDQGAVAALPILRVQNRYQSGLVEVKMKEFVQDKTDWRKMLKGDPEVNNLYQEKKTILENMAADKSMAEILPTAWIESTITSIEYPVIEYPKKVVSLNIQKTPKINGTLLGIKGQYLILDIGVINIRNLSGYDLKMLVD